ncbi:MAG: DUF389 domain-containing protein [Thermodesulfobacteriota bacterium]
MAWQLDWIKTSPERAEQVIREIGIGSEPALRFYAMVATSTLIASFGLIANSTAVIIGAMLVAPLMTPIFGIALALVRGDPSLLGRAVWAEVMGVILALCISAFFGFLPLAVEVTPEMLSRTQPNLLDLLVAVLAGFAGAYALVDEHLSPALPGVAIATAIVPPLANAGLCLALGAYLGAMGSFLLFLANFLSILLVASATFIAAGMAPKFELSLKGELGRRFGVAAFGFVVVAVLLTNALVGIVKNRYLSNSINRLITQEFSQLPTTNLVKMIYQISEGKLYVLATVRTPKVISPKRVEVIQRALAEQLQWPTELIVRSVLAKDVSATGSTSLVTAENLDGSFLGGKVNPDVLKVQKAEQALREAIVARPELELADVDLLYFPRGPVILATIRGPRVLIPSEISAFEKVIQERLNDPGILLLARCLTSTEVDKDGRVLYGWSHFGDPTPEKKKLMEEIEKAVRGELGNYSDIFPINVDAAPKEDYWGVRVEAVGPRVVSARDVARLERAISRRVHQPVKIYLWSRAEAMVTSDGYSSLEDFTRQRLEEREEARDLNQSLTKALPAPSGAGANP